MLTDEKRRDAFELAPLIGHHQYPSVFISVHQCSSVSISVISVHQCYQYPSVFISSHQCSSVFINQHVLINTHQHSIGNPNCSSVLIRAHQCSSSTRQILIKQITRTRKQGVHADNWITCRLHADDYLEELEAKGMFEQHVVLMVVSKVSVVKYSECLSSTSC